MLVLPALLRSIGLHGKEEDKIHRVSNCDAINQELRHVVDSDHGLTLQSRFMQRAWTIYTRTDV